uniref:EamA domain-containing protein n=1 Tax=Euplotes crassus TaxID=5936 RepID=A0A7S3KFA9_EUPCR
MVLGLSNILQTVIISCFCSNFLNFSHYRLIDLLILNIHGMLSAVWIPLMFLAAKYAEASFISPILNIENVFTILIDMFVFGYTFISTEFIGMGILGTCIVIPILKNYFGRK